MCELYNTRHSSFSIFYYFNLTNRMVAANRFENPDDEVRVVRNLYILVSL